MYVAIMWLFINFFLRLEKSALQRVELMMEVVPLALEFVAFVRMIYFGLKYISWKIKSLFSVTLSSGGSASENSTHIVQTSATAVPSPCTYTICRCSTNICRIRFDFTVSKGKFTELVWCWSLKMNEVF